jgi:hypothetical protein
MSNKGLKEQLKILHDANINAIKLSIKLCNNFLDMINKAINPKHIDGYAEQAKMFGKRAAHDSRIAIRSGQKLNATLIKSLDNIKKRIMKETSVKEINGKKKSIIKRLMEQKVLKDKKKLDRAKRISTSVSSRSARSEARNKARRLSRTELKSLIPIMEVNDIDAMEDVLTPEEQREIEEEYIALQEEVDIEDKDKITTTEDTDDIIDDELDELERKLEEELEKDDQDYSRMVDEIKREESLQSMSSPSSMSLPTTSARKTKRKPRKKSGCCGGPQSHGETKRKKRSKQPKKGKRKKTDHKKKKRTTTKRKTMRYYTKLRR